MRIHAGKEGKRGNANKDGGGKMTISKGLKYGDKGGRMNVGLSINTISQKIIITCVSE